MQRSTMQVHAASPLNPSAVLGGLGLRGFGDAVVLLSEALLQISRFGGRDAVEGVLGDQFG